MMICSRHGFPSFLARGCLPSGEHGSQCDSGDKLSCLLACHLTDVIYNYAGGILNVRVPHFPQARTPQTMALGPHPALPFVPVTLGGSTSAYTLWVAALVAAETVHTAHEAEHVSSLAFNSKSSLLCLKPIPFQFLAKGCYFP